MKIFTIIFFIFFIFSSLTSSRKKFKEVVLEKKFSSYSTYDNNKNFRIYPLDKDSIVEKIKSSDTTLFIFYTNTCGAVYYPWTNILNLKNIKSKHFKLYLVCTDSNINDFINYDSSSSNIGRLGYYLNYYNLDIKTYHTNGDNFRNEIIFPLNTSVLKTKKQEFYQAFLISKNKIIEQDISYFLLKDKLKLHYPDFNYIKKNKDLRIKVLK